MAKGYKITAETGRRIARTMRRVDRQPVNSKQPRRAMRIDHRHAIIVELDEDMDDRAGFFDANVMRDDKSGGLEATGETVQVWGIMLPAGMKHVEGSVLVCVWVYGLKRSGWVPICTRECPVRV